MTSTIAETDDTGTTDYSWTGLTVCLSLLNITGGDIAGNSVTGTFNLIGDGSGGLTDPSNIQPVSGNTPIDPMLAQLGDYGGSTQTMPPLPGSPAVGASALFDDQNDNLITTDQRGLALPSDSPDIGSVEAIDVPTGLTPTVFSSTQINLEWTDESAIATNDLIYESTDGGATFNPVDEVAVVAPGDTNSYQATGLNAGTDYQFYIVADAGVAQSTPSASVNQPTPFETPTLDVEGTGTVVENQPYELDLSADYPDGEPGAVSQWLVDWNDGLGGTSHVITYNVPADFDASQPFVVTHTFAAGIASPNVVVTAVDSVNGQWTADPQAVAVTPVAPVLNSATASSNSITVGWSNASCLSTGTTVLLSTDGTNFFEYGDAASGATSLTVSNLNLHTEYWVETLTDSVNGISDATTAQSVNTLYVQPTLVVTAPYPATVGRQYTLDCSATYAPGTLQSDMIAGWTINWGDGSATQTYGSAAGVFTSPTGNYAAGNSQVQITAIDGNGNPIGYPTQNVTFSAPGTYSGTLVSSNGPYSILPVDAQIVVGGTGYVPVEFNGPLSVNLSYTSSDPSVMTSIGWGPDDSNGDRQLIVQAISEGTADIIVSDGLGDVNYTRFATAAPGVTVNNSGDETEGVTYGPGGAIPGFTFNLDGAISLSPVTINFSTAGSTLPTSLWSSLTSGSVTIPAGVNSLFVPFSTSDDGKIAPTRAAVITLTTPGDLFSFGDQTAVMNVVNTDVPSITVDGEQDGASVSLDKDNDQGLLAPVQFTINHDGTIESTTLTWNPSQDVIWPTDQIGTVGVGDLASLHGVTSDVDGDHYTWQGAPPQKVWDQAVGGSSVMDGTSLMLQVTVFRPATQAVVQASATPYNASDKTNQGIWINVSGSAIVPDQNPAVTGQTVIGAGVYLSVGYQGPLTTTGGLTDIQWFIQGATTSMYSSTAIAGYNPTSRPVNGQSTQISFLTSAMLQQPSVDFYYLSLPTLNSLRRVSVHATLGGFGYMATATIRVLTPESSFEGDATQQTPTIAVSDDGLTDPNTSQPTLHFGIKSDPGMSYNGSVIAPSIDGGTIFVTQLVSGITKRSKPGSFQYSITGGTVLDNGKLALGGVFNHLNPGIQGGIKVVNPNGSLSNLSDTPDVSVLDYTAISRYFFAIPYLMWLPDGRDSIPVSLRRFTWDFDTADFKGANGWNPAMIFDAPPAVTPSSFTFLLPTWTKFDTNGWVNV